MGRQTAARTCGIAAAVDSGEDQLVAATTPELGSLIRELNLAHLAVHVAGVPTFLRLASLEPRMTQAVPNELLRMPLNRSRQSELQADRLQVDSGSISRPR